MVYHCHIASAIVLVVKQTFLGLGKRFYQKRQSYYVICMKW